MFANIVPPLALFTSSLLLTSAAPLTTRHADQAETGYIQVTSQSDGTTGYLVDQLTTDTGVFPSNLTSDTTQALGIYFQIPSKKQTASGSTQNIIAFDNNATTNGYFPYLCAVQCQYNTNVTTDGTSISASDLVSGSKKWVDDLDSQHFKWSRWSVWPSCAYLTLCQNGDSSGPAKIGNNSVDNNQFQLPQEASIWEYVKEGSILLPSWVNTDGTSVLLDVVAGDGLMLLTADSETYINAYGGNVVVSSWRF